MPLTDRKRAIYVALFFALFLPLVAFAGPFYALEVRGALGPSFWQRIIGSLLGIAMTKVYHLD